MKMKSVEIYLLQVIFKEKNVLSGLKTIRNFIYCVTRDFKNNFIYGLRFWCKIIKVILKRFLCKKPVAGT